MTDFVITVRLDSENNREYALRLLYDNIIKMRLKPGTLLNENELAQLLNVSRTPIREAILQLKELNLVDVYPQKASVVTRINLGLLYEGYFLRSEIEPVVYKLACRGPDTVLAALLKENLEAQREIVEGGCDYAAFFELDNEFHEHIYNATGKSHVWKAIQSVSSHFHRIRFFDAISAAENLELVYEDHKTIYYGVISASFLPIQEIYPGHLSLYQKTMPRLLEEYANYFEL